LNEPGANTRSVSKMCVSPATDFDTFLSSNMPPSTGRERRQRRARHSAAPSTSGGNSLTTATRHDFASRSTTPHRAIGTPLSPDHPAPE
jgi:hypothetical protein